MARTSPLPKLRARIVPQIERRLSGDLSRYFGGTLDRLGPAIERVCGPIAEAGTKARDVALLERVDVKLRTLAWDREARLLRAQVGKAYTVAAEGAAKAVAGELALSDGFTLSARSLGRIQGDLARRIVRVTDTSRNLIAGQIVDGIEKGLSIRQIVNGVPPGMANIRGPIPAFDGIRGTVNSWASTTWGSRASQIAKTETGNAFNLSSIAAYRDSGLVRFVEVFDGQDCGWLAHDDPDFAHGSIRTLEASRAHPLSHPNCQRAFGAKLSAAEERASPYAAARAEGRSVPGSTPGIGAVDPLDAEAVAHSGLGSVRPTLDVAEASQRAWELAREAERAVTASIEAAIEGRAVTYAEAMQQRPAAPGGDLAGLENRQKTLSSLSRKIRGEIDEAATKGHQLSVPDSTAAIGDRLRYTYRFSPEEFADGVTDATRALREAGNVPIKWKPTWTDDLYRGLNTNWRAPNGATFEVQFHTPFSFWTKETIHPWYEEYRLAATSLERKAVLRELMSGLTTKVPAPGGIFPQSLEDALGARPIQLSFLDDPEVIAARARLAEAKRVYNSLPRGAERVLADDEVFAAGNNLERVARAAEERVRERALSLSADQARITIRAMDARLGQLFHEIRAAGLEMSQALTRKLPYNQRLEISDRLGRLHGEMAAIKKARTHTILRLPLRERILPRPTLPSRIGHQQTALYDRTLEIVEYLERETGEASAWSGEIQIGTRPGAAGTFNWSTGVLAVSERMAEPGANQGHVVSVLTHELFHSFSRLDGMTYSGRIGWEEGVVERAAQLFAGRVRTAIGMTREGYETYEDFVGALERARTTLAAALDEDLPGEAFYRGLLRLRTPDERLASIDKMMERAIEHHRGKGIAMVRKLMKSVRADLVRALDVEKGV